MAEKEMVLRAGERSGPQAWVLELGEDDVSHLSERDKSARCLVPKLHPPKPADLKTKTPDKTKNLGTLCSAFHGVLWPALNQQQVPFSMCELGDPLLKFSLRVQPTSSKLSCDVSRLDPQDGNSVRPSPPFIPQAKKIDLDILARSPS